MPLLKPRHYRGFLIQQNLPLSGRILQIYGEHTFYKYSRGGLVSHKELLDEIERLRAEMNSLAVAGANYGKLLEISQKLDELIVLFYETTA